MTEYGLVMPFTCCKSQGGPYEDSAFVAGARFMTIMQRCGLGETPIRSFEPSALIDQLDLVAMRYNYEITERDPWCEDPDTWTFVVLEKVKDD